MVCLEAGPRLTLSDIVNDSDTMFGRLTWLDKRIGTGELNPGLPLWVCKTVGGTTVHWAGAALRFQEHEFKTRTIYGQIQGANMLDWPLSFRSSSRSTTRPRTSWASPARTAFRGCPATTTTRCWRPAPSASATRSSTAATWRSTPQPRDGRPACHQIGFCMAGCAIGAKWSTLYTEIPKAEATGHFELRPESMALSITHDASGKVTGVVYADKAGNHYEQKARAVCVAGNSVETPRLLLNSASSKYPERDGELLRSGGPQLHAAHERNGLCHHARPGEFRARHPDGGYRQGRGAASIRKRGFAGGYEMETLPGFGLAGIATNLIPGAWGRDYTRIIEMYDHFAGMWLVGEDLPQQGNGVTLHPTEKDQHGLPVPVVHFTDHANDFAMRNHAFKAGSRDLPIARCDRGVRAAAVPEHAQHGHVPSEREPAGWRVQQLRAVARYPEPVHLGRQPVHHLRAREPDAHDRCAGHPAGRIRRRPVEQEPDVGHTRRKPGASRGGHLWR